MKRTIKICVNFIIVSVLLLIFPIISSAYSNQLPAYLGSFPDAAYIELNTSNFGRCAFVLPVSYQTETISYNGNKIYNSTASTLYGYLVTQNGTVYDIRAQRLSNFQYAYTSGYQTQYVDINYSEIYNTNIRFTNADSDNEFVKLNPYQIITVTLLVFLSISELGNLIFNIVRNRYYA